MTEPLVLTLPPELLEAVARRTAEIVLERLGADGRGKSATPWLSVHEAAVYLRCDRQRIYEMRCDGRLTAHKEGGRAVVARAELEALVKA